MSLFEKLPNWFESRPLVILRFNDGFEAKLRGTTSGMDRFTVVKNHGAFSDVKLPSLCIAAMLEGPTSKFYVGVVKSKTAVGTFDSRVTIVKLKKLELHSFDDLQQRLDGKIFKTLLAEKLTSSFFAIGLSPKLSIAIIEALAKNPENKSAIEVAAAHVPKFRQINGAVWEQLDAIKMAIAAFGLSKSDFPKELDVPVGSDSTLNHFDNSHAGSKHNDEDDDGDGNEGNGTVHVLEDNVIAKDASVIPGFELIEKHLTGKAIFSAQSERLEVFTANKGPLEEMLGVDLIYINEVAGNTVMVQYKMLTAHTDPATAKSDWIFRPDSQFELEVARMRLPTLDETIDDYRLLRSPFLFKFVKRKGDGESHASFIVPLNHLNHILDSPNAKGPRGGIRIGFESLGGIYLREADLIGLIRSGYIGTHRVETEALKPIIQAVSEGKRALVLAWQKQVNAKFSANIDED